MIAGALLALAQEPAPWLRAEVQLDAPGKLALQLHQQGWDGRTLEVLLQRGAPGEPPATSKLPKRLLTPGGDDGDRVRLDIPPGDGELWLTLRERSGGGLVLEAPLEFRHFGWFVCGPFPVSGNGFGKKLAPENGPLDFGESFETADGARSWLSFDAAELLRGGRLDFSALLGGRDHAVAYVGTRWKFTRRTKAQLRLGSDDVLEVFLNGRRVHANPALRGAAPGQDLVEVTFQQGDNDLLLKVGNEGGAWALYFAAAAPDGAPLRDYEVMTVATAGWKPGPPPRIVEVAGERVVLEFGAPVPVPAHALLRRARSEAPNPRDWLSRGVAMALPYEVEERAVSGDGVLRTRHRIAFERLERGVRWAALGVPDAADPAHPAPPQAIRPWRLFRIPPAAGTTAVHHLRIAAVFFADVVEQGRGEERELPRAELEERIAAMLAAFEETRRFYYVHSGCRLALDLESFVDWERHVIAPGSEYGFGYSGQEWDAVERVLGETGRGPGDFDSYLLISCDRSWDGGQWQFPASGGGTYGPLAPFGAGKSGWRSGCDPAWLYCHEFGRVLDAMWAESGYPEFPWEGAAYRHGEHWDGKGWLLRAWAGHARHGAPAPWLPGEFGWRYFVNAWGAVRDYADGDADGVPDDAENLPLDEQRFGSSTSAADSDRDGLGDLEELMRGAWLVRGLDERQAGAAPRLLSPAAADGDGDGRTDGADPQPLWAVPDDLSAPQEFVVQDPAAGEMRLRLAWHEGALRVTVRAERGLERARVLLDADDDGWYLGGDNLRIEFRAGGVWERDLWQCGVPDRAGFSQAERVPADMFSVDSSASEGVTLTIRPRPELGFAGAPGEPIGIHVALHLGAARSPGDGPRGLVTFFEPHAFFRTKLP